jgi:hypothetical protein
VSPKPLEKRPAAVSPANAPPRIELDDLKVMGPISADARLSAKSLVDAQRGFTSTRQCPAPSASSGNELDDLAAVVAGSSPGAFVDHMDDPRMEILLKMAVAGGNAVDTLPIRNKDGDVISRSYLVGAPPRVAEVKRVALELEASGGKGPSLHQRMGALLGYHPDAIADYVGLQEKGDVRALQEYVKRTWKQA